MLIQFCALFCLYRSSATVLAGQVADFGIFFVIFVTKCQLDWMRRVIHVWSMAGYCSFSRSLMESLALAGGASECFFINFSFLTPFGTFRDEHECWGTGFDLSLSAFNAIGMQSCLAI